MYSYGPTLGHTCMHACRLHSYVLYKQGLTNLIADSYFNFFTIHLDKLRPIKFSVLAIVIAALLEIL